MQVEESKYVYFDRRRLVFTAMEPAVSRVLGQPLPLPLRAPPNGAPCESGRLQLQRAVGLQIETASAGMLSVSIDEP